MASLNALNRAGFIAASVTLVALGISGCAAGTTLADADTEIISQLTAIAPRDSGIAEPVTEVECWQPSDSMLDDEQFRVLCRVHYEQAGNDRYRDMICVGDVGAEPVTEYCYRWAYYTDMPEFADKLGHSVA